MTKKTVITQLKHFQLKGNGYPNDQQLCRAYRNNRQQFQLDIIIDAWGPTGVVELTQEQLQSVQLINYSSGAIIDTGGSQLTRSYIKNIYEYFPGGPAVNEGTPHQSMSQITLFISIPTTALFDTLHVGAQIILDGTPYKTNNAAVPPGGELHEGGFNSSILVKYELPYRLSASAFHIERTQTYLPWYYDAGHGDSKQRYFDKWEITLIQPPYNIYSSDLPSPHTINWFSQYVRNGDDLDTCHWALPIRDVGTPIYLAYVRSGPSNYDCYVYPYTRRGAAYAIIEKANSFEIFDYNHKQISYIDSNGCEHSVVLRPNNNGTTFQIDDYFKEDDPSESLSISNAPEHPATQIIATAITAGITAGMKSVIDSLRRQ